MAFDWDPEKARANLAKHRVSFSEASTVFSDPFANTNFDPDHSEAEMRYITFGMSSKGRLLAVAHTDDEVRIRIISSRVASNRERILYEESS